MIKKKLDDWKIHFILVCDSKDEADAQIKILSEKGLLTPEGYECSMQVVIGKKNLAATFNDIQKKNNARFKFYLTAPLLHVENNLLIKMIEGFFMEPKTAMIGLMGSELPITGDYRRAQNFYGLYNFGDDFGKIHNYMGKDFLLYKSVHMIESSFFATNEDIAWDEKIGDDFIIAAQCCNLRSRGYDIGVYYQEKPLIIFAKNTFSYTSKTDGENYNKQLEKFFSLYKKKIQPLVSVLIPTYNQPKFCCAALESALNQTYQNIEILIGDDSTNEDTKKAIRPYLKKNPNVKYFYHNGKIARGGGANMNFLLNSCTGEFVNYLLHDDIFYPEKISKMMNYYVNDLENKICLISSARDRIDANGNFLNRQNQWQPHADTIISAEEMGRRMLFVLANSVGELTTVLFRKASAKSENNIKMPFAIGSFCGVSSRTYGDLDTWLNILKNGGDFIFMAESLSAFRKHEAQNTYNPQTRINLPLDALMFVVVAWLNDAFFRNVNEFNYCLDKWPLMADRWFKPIQEDDSDKIKYFKNWIIKLREVFLRKNHEKMLDSAISFLLDYMPGNMYIIPRIIKNPYNGLWEKNSVPVLADMLGIDLCNNFWASYRQPKISKTDSNNKAIYFDRSAIYSLTTVTIGGADFTIGCHAFLDQATATAGEIFALHVEKFGVFAPKPLTFIGLRRSAYDGNKNLRLSLIDSLSNNLISAENREITDVDAVGYTQYYEFDYSHENKTLKFFVNGICKFIQTEIEIERLNRYITLGALPTWPSIRYMVGYIDEFVIKDGVCEHDSDFTPEPYKFDDYTKCFLNFDKIKI